MCHHGPHLVPAAHLRCTTWLCISGYLKNSPYGKPGWPLVSRNLKTLLVSGLLEVVLRVLLVFLVIYIPVYNPSNALRRCFLQSLKE